MRARPALLGLLWVAVTMALTVTTWLAVSLVAGAVDGDPSHVLSAAAVESAAAQQPPTGASPHASASPSHSAEPRHSATPGHSHSSRPSSSTPASHHAGSSPSVTHSAPHQSSTPKPSATRSSGTTTVPKSRTFAVTGGTVAAACTGSAISLRSAQPADGWRVEVGDRGPEHLEVKFRSGEQETQVELECSAGVPVMSGSDDGGGGDGGSDD